MDKAVLEIPYFWEVFITFLGLCLGSFANVVIYRLPEGLSVVKPRSHCFSCKKMVAWYDNIPVVSWFMLGGKCRHCKAKVSWRYPFVEFLMGLFFLLIFLKYGWSWTTLEYLVFTFMALTASFIDIDHMILPDGFTLGGLALCLVGAVLSPEREFMPALYGFLFGGGFLWLIAYTYFVFRKEEGMGGGDIKLLAWIGALLGWKAIPFVILCSSLVGSFLGLGLVLISKGNMKTAIPFGPYLVFGALLYILYGLEIGQWYLSIFIPSLSQ